MYVTLNVYTWLEVHKNRGRIDLNRVGNYVLASSEDRQEFDKFRESDFFNKRSLIKTAVLEKFMEEQCQCKINLRNKFGIDFVTNFPTSQFDDLAVGHTRCWEWGVCALENVSMFNLSCLYMCAYYYTFKKIKNFN